MVGDSSVPSGFRRLSGRLGKAAVGCGRAGVRTACSAVLAQQTDCSRTRLLTAGKALGVLVTSRGKASGVLIDEGSGSSD